MEHNYRRLSEFRCSASSQIRRVVISKFNCSVGSAGGPNPPDDFYKDYHLMKRLFSVGFGTLHGVYHHTPTGSSPIICSFSQPLVRCRG